MTAAADAAPPPAWLSRLAAPRAALAQLAALSALRLALAARLPITGDEALMWYWTKWLDWCYVEHPGLMPAVTWLSTRLFGDAVWSVRLGAVGFGAFFLAAIYRLGARLKDRETGWLCALALALTPIFTAGSLLALTDIFYAALVLGALACFHAAKSRPSRYLAGGLLLGLAINAKLLAGIYPPALGLALAWARPRHLRRAEPWLAGLICAAAALPPLLWNRAHGWASFKIRLDHEPLDHFSLAYTARIAAAGFVLLTPFLFLPALRALARLPGQWRRRDDDAVMLGFPAAALLALVAVKSLRSSVDFHWAMLAWVPLLLLAARDGLRRFWPLAGAVAGGLFTAALLAIALRPGLIPDRFALPGVARSKGDGLKMVLTDREPTVARAAAELRARPGAFLMSDGYGLVCSARLYLAAEGLAPDLALLEVQHRNGANFALWEPAMRFEGRPAVFFNNHDPADDAVKEGELARLFGSCCRAPDLVIGAAGTEYGRVRVYRCDNFLGFKRREQPYTPVELPPCPAP